MARNKIARLVALGLTRAQIRRLMSLGLTADEIYCAIEGPGPWTLSLSED